jgi:hypothetical protein
MNVCMPNTVTSKLLFKSQTAIGFYVKTMSAHDSHHGWRIKGVEEPSKKRKSTEDKLNYFKDYDKKRKRQYNMYLKLRIPK